MKEGGRIWVTRALPGAEATAGRLRVLGRSPLVASLLEVRPLPLPSGPPDGFAALAFTSANAVRAFAAWTPQRGWPVFAVGAATAEAARSAGFTEVDSADGDVAALAHRIAAQGPSGPLLHPCASEAAGDLAGALVAAGVCMRALPIYETLAVERLPACVTAALDEDALDAVLLHSPKAARTLSDVWAVGGVPAIDRVRLLGLSPACLTPVAHLPFVSAVSATQPNETAMLELL